MRSHNRSERGAAMVEMAIILPLFLLLVFGIMEAGWMFAQQVEVRHGAREAARIAAVSNPPNPGFTVDHIKDRACDTMNLSNGSVTSIVITSSGAEVGDNATITIVVEYQSLTGILDSIFDGLSIDTTVDIRLEQPKAWADAPPGTYAAVSPASVCP